jgi:hypothetical protein
MHLFLLFFLWRNSPPWARASSFMRFLDHTQRRTTFGRTPLDKRSTRSRDLYLTIHNTHNRQTSMPPVGSEPTISAGEWPQSYTLDRAASGIGHLFLKHEKKATITFMCLKCLSSTFIGKGCSVWAKITSEMEVVPLFIRRWKQMSAALQRTVIAINLKFYIIIWFSTAIDSRESEPINIYNNQHTSSRKISFRYQMRSLGWIYIYPSC